MINKIVKNFSKVLLIIFVTILLFSLYRYKTLWGENLNLYYKEYYLNYIKISIFFIFLSFIFLFLNEEKNEYLFIFFISLIISCYSFETYIVVKKKKILIN